jgi:aspergillopepsin I
MFTADGYKIGTATGASGSLTGIADTGTTLLLIDDSVVSEYYAKVKGAKNDATQGGFTFPCSATLPNFSLVIGGETRTGKSLEYHNEDRLKLTKPSVPGSYVNYAPISSGSSTCFGGIQSDAGVGFSIFGDIFLKSQYVVFDVSTGAPRIAFGQQ